MIYEGRSSPVASKQEVVVGAEHSGLGHGLLLEISSIFLITEILDNEVVGIDREVKTSIVMVNSLRSMEETELVDRSTPLMVTKILTTIVHIITRFTRQNLCRGIDTRTTINTTHCINLEALVSSSQSLLSISIRLIEGLCTQTGLLRDVEFVFTCC